MHNLRDLLDLADALRFNSNDEKPELSYLYEAKLQGLMLRNP